MIERINRTLKNMIISFVSKNQKEWDQHIRPLIMAYRSSVHEDTGVSPSMFMLAREIRLPIDLVMGCPQEPENIEINMSEYAYLLQERMEKVYSLAGEKLVISANIMKNYHDRKITSNTHKVGDAVWYYNPQSSQGHSKKLKLKWQGPFLVTETMNKILYRMQVKPKKSLE